MLNNENSIEVRNVSKSFKVYFDKGNELKEKMLFWKRNRYENRVVLNNISFTVKKGEAVGLIGRNGCGKSTTLKLLTKIIYPDSGSIEMCGRVSSLLELGAGFHPDMSGRENIYTNAAIFGLTKKEIDERLEDIIEFSELQQFIDNPVRTYSSGMYMRLAFSVAINVNADILLIDEILAVGDANFQAKCFNKLREIKANGTTIIIVSHALGQNEEICDKSIWIKDGQIEQEGDPREVDIAYLDYMNQERLSKDEQERARILRIEAEQRRLKKAEEENKEGGNDKRYGSFEARINDVILSCDDGKRTETLETGRKAVIEIDYSVETSVKEVHARYMIYRIDGQLCSGSSTKIDRLDAFDLEKDGKIVIEFNKEMLSKWLGIPAVKDVSESYAESYKDFCQSKGWTITSVRNAVYVLMHTFAHLLIKQMSMSSGYSSSAIRERIYFGDNMAGILLYTGSADKEGSLGGLVELGSVSQLTGIMRDAFQEALVCTNDPECMNNMPAGKNSNGAACHSCCMISETACENGNRMLDRGLVVPIPGREDNAYFRELVNDLCQVDL